MLMTPTLIGITASVPQVSLKGVSPVGVLTIVLYAHQTLGNSFGHASFASSSQTLMIFSNVQFVTFVCPLACGCPRDENWFLIPSPKQKFLKSWLSNYCPWYPESANYIFPHKVLDLCLSDSWQCFCFNPFHKVVNCDQQEFYLSLTLGQWAHDVNPSLGKWRRGGYGGQLLSWDALNILKPLTLVTSFNKLLCVSLHSRPEITYSDDLTYQGSQACVVSHTPL